MTIDNAIVLIEKARKLAKTNDMNAEKVYLTAIEELKTPLNTDQEKAYLWTTQAEYLVFRSQYIFANETIEDSRNKQIEALRLLNKTSNLNNDLKEKVAPNIRQIINQIITIFGCILPEEKNKIHVSCPIRIRNTGAGKFGFSIGMYYEQAVCSICGRDILNDAECIHNEGIEYDGKRCYIIPKNIVMDHVAMTENPKDPNCKILEVCFPISDFYEGFTEEEIKEKELKKLPFVCNICKNEKITPTEIDLEKFFNMQHLEL